MIIGIGTDLVAIQRLESSFERFGEPLLVRILTPTERLGAQIRSADKAVYLASRFAAKEAGVKALGTGFRNGVGLHQLEVRREADHPPHLFLYGAAQQRAEQLGVERIHLSLSRDRAYTIAMVVLEGHLPGSPA